MSHKRSVEDKRRLEKTYNKTKSKYGPGVWYDEKKKRFIRLDFTNKWLKNHCKRITRHKLKQGDIINGCHYKKVYDYWWELY